MPRTIMRRRACSLHMMVLLPPLPVATLPKAAPQSIGESLGRACKAGYTCIRAEPEPRWPPLAHAPSAFRYMGSVPVIIRFERSLFGNSDIGGLLVFEFGQFDAKLR